MDSHEIFEIVGPGVAATPVGSRVTCDPAPADTDEDWLICTRRRDISDRLDQAGFHAEGSPEFYTGNDNGEFRSWRRGNLNLIVTPDLAFYDRFETATALAKRFNLLDKRDRIALFQAVLYGVRWHNLEA
ncbi:MAG: hypothetical protein AAGJ83_07310 [Planctomycetota bacterium]